MPYDKELDDRLNAVVADWGTTPKKMFGGTCNLLNGNMMCGVYKDFLILRLGEEEAKAALSQPNVKLMDFTGRAMKGWVMVAKQGLTDEALKQWLHKAKHFAESLPPKSQSHGMPTH
jgi:TfoX/Sxy family transcriptional regulator of competence genes